MTRMSIRGVRGGVGYAALPLLYFDTDEVRQGRAGEVLTSGAGAGPLNVRDIG